MRTRISGWRRSLRSVRHLGVGAAVALLAGFSLSLQPAAASPLGDGLVGYWPFDSATAGVSSDLANGYDATLNGGAAIGAPATGNVAHNTAGLALDGVDGYASVAPVADLGMTSAYGVSTWANLDSSVLSSQYQPVAFRATANADDIEIYVQANTGDLIVAHNRGNGGTFSWVTFPDPPMDTWFHLAVTFDGTNVNAYYDGVAQEGLSEDSTSPATLPAPLFNSSAGWWFGKVDHQDFEGGGLPAASFLKGGLDEMRIYDRALSQDEVSALADYDNFSFASLTPDGMFNPINTSRTFMATLTPALAYIPIDFEAGTYNSPAPATHESDALGQATYSYTGTVAGNDTVTAFVDADNDGLDLTDPQMSVHQYWYSDYTTFGGNAGNVVKGGSLQYGFEGFAGTVPGYGAFGSISVTYRGLKQTCTFTPTGASTFAVYQNQWGLYADMQGWTNSCGGTAQIQVLDNGSFSQFPRGAIMVNPTNTTYAIGTVTAWTVGLATGQVHVFHLT